MRTSHLAVLLLALALPLALTGCGGKDQPTITPTPTPDERATEAPRPPAPAPPRVEVDDGRQFPTEPTTVEPIEPTIDELNRRGLLGTVYFSYDSFDLRDTSLATLRANANWLKANPARRIVVQGHCDERGTIDYNLALGERRAKSVRDYLLNLGIAADQVRIISYGEERPADPGHTEAAWSQNRRGEFVIER